MKTAKLKINRFLCGTSQKKLFFVPCNNWHISKDLFSVTIAGVTNKTGLTAPQPVRMQNKIHSKYSPGFRTISFHHYAFANHFDPSKNSTASVSHSSSILSAFHTNFFPSANNINCKYAFSCEFWKKAHKWFGQW